MARTVNPDRAAERRRQILEAAHTCFTRKGFHQTSMDEICAEAGISPGGLYRYFPSKEALIEALGEEGRVEISDLFSAIAAGDDVIKGLSDLVARFAEQFIAEASAGIGVELSAEALRNPVIATSLRAAKSQIIKDLTRLLVHGQSRGQVDATLHPEQAATVLLSAADGLSLRIALGHAITPAEATATLQTLLTRYLRPAGAA